MKMVLVLALVMFSARSFAGPTPGGIENSAPGTETPSEDLIDHSHQKQIQLDDKTQTKKPTKKKKSAAKPQGKDAAPETK